MTAETRAAIPLWLLYEEELDGWRKEQPAAAASWVAAHHFKGEKHRTLLVPDGGGGVAMAVGGLGKRQGGLSLWHAAGFAERLPPGHYRLAHPFTDAEATQLALGFAYGAYRFERYRPARVERAAVLEPPPNADMRFVAAASQALTLARDLINTPASDLGPPELSAAARSLAERRGAQFREWVGDALLTDNFPAIHAVGRASAQAPRLIELRWKPGGSSVSAGGSSRSASGSSPAAAGALPRIALVGKGVCFDSGGLDIKPSSGMALMKKDMGGAAVALALADMLMAAPIRAELTILVPAVENAIGGNAYRPGDVLSTRKGLTVEVGNTDAEGRLVLCDALALADAEQQDLILDFATLTGAARVALGPELPALFGTDERVVAELARAAALEHDPLWPMPLWMGYDDELGSKIADMNNVASSGLAGAIFGALFLKRFVTATPHWLHLDLYAWNPKERPGRGVGAEAHAVRGVYRYLLQRYGTVAS
ncbi:MAG TPA: leucyl aminopeptidase family protein [Steroidobacteraceae bacterium]|nr:leucyl aminopeptidase family protein [Steroidobacteraceae bacterium]